MADLTHVATTVGREATKRARDFAETNPVAKKAKDAVYTAVGFGVLSTQKAAAAVKGAQVTLDTDSVTESVKRSVADVSESVKRQALRVDERVIQAVKTIDEAVAPLEQKLPAAVRDVAAKAREARSRFLRRDAAEVEPVIEPKAAKKAPKADGSSNPA